MFPGATDYRYLLLNCRMSRIHAVSHQITEVRHPNVEEAGLKPGSMPLSLSPVTTVIATAAIIIIVRAKILS